MSIMIFYNDNNSDIYLCSHAHTPIIQQKILNYNDIAFALIKVKNVRYKKGIIFQTMLTRRT